MDASTVEKSAPRFTRTDARGVAHRIYGLDASVERMPSERDQNFLLNTPGGRFVLKIANACERRECLEFQNRVLELLASSEQVFPGVIPSPSGAAIESLEDEAGRSFFVRLVTFLPGKLLVDVRPHDPELLHQLGELLGRMDETLKELPEPPQRDLKWDLARADWIEEVMHFIPVRDRRVIVEQILESSRERLLPALSRLPGRVIHNDANDYNVLVDNRGLEGQKVAGLIDFGDMVAAARICEPAVASAYAMLGKVDPLAAAASIAAGYHRASPLSESEVELLYPCIRLRLAVSVANSAWQQSLNPDNPYLQVSDRPAWELLEKLETVPPQLAHYRLRQACGLEPCPSSPRLVSWLRGHRSDFAPVLDRKFSPENLRIFDSSAGSPEFSEELALGDQAALSRRLFDLLESAGASVGVGRYDEARLVYAGEAYQEAEQRRTIHLGIDLFTEPGTPVFAPLEGTIHSFRHNDQPLDYGPTVILEHCHEGDGIHFFTLYGHLSRRSLEDSRTGMAVAKGERIGWVGDQHENGGWPPHLHFQIVSDLMGWEGDFPGVAAPSQREVWLSLCPDPSPLLGISPPAVASRGLSHDAILRLRREHLGRSLSLSYRRPLKIVRGFMQRLFDEEGQPYLDCVNNVAHVGHCHPKVVRAAALQMAVLNTNTRYLHDHLASYAERLCGLFPAPLDVCFLVCSGSEANELALRLARTHTGQHDTIVLEGAYHGNTGGLVEISPYKFDGPGGQGAPPFVHVVPMPDPFRGIHRGTALSTGTKYAAEVESILARMEQQGRRPGVLIYESLLGCGGQIVLPPEFLRRAQHAVHSAGGVCIADEVQVGFGRVGSHWWGFELQEVVPDIVTLGKPIGNGHPIGAVVTTREIADSFANGMEYFNTFGGNPVSCAAALAVLDVIEEEGLREHALEVGGTLKTGLQALQETAPLIGEVRGEGLFLGFELVLDPETLAPAPAQAAYLVERMKQKGVLLSTDGPLHNVVKIKPPLPFSRDDADFFLETLADVLRDDYLS